MHTFLINTTLLTMYHSDMFQLSKSHLQGVDCIWNVMAHAQKPDFIFRRNGQVHLNWRGHQFIRLLAAEVCASAVVMLDTPRSEVVWRVLATHSTGRRPFTYWNRGFEPHRGHGYLSVVSAVCCQVEVSATSWSLVQRSPTDCAASLCVI
jgi:hypothetical protein